MNNQKYCIVGYGEHAKNKIIPSILKIGSKIVGVVSKKNKIDKNFYRYKNLEDALNNVPKKTIFILCSPPNIHSTQALKILKSGFNLFIEKPVTISVKSLKKIILLAKKNNLFFVEGFMYKYSNTYKKFLKIWFQKKKEINKIDIFFLIPKAPINTFRTQNANYSTNLFDIGSYLISLINDLYGKAKFKLISVKNFGYPRKEFFEINSVQQTIKITGKFGVYKDYMNKIDLSLNENNFYSFKPFFYGRNGQRKIEYFINSKTKRTIMNEDSSFGNMFKKNNKYWLSTQEERNLSMLNNLKSLESLNKQYNNIRGNK